MKVLTELLTALFSRHPSFVWVTFNKSGDWEVFLMMKNLKVSLCIAVYSEMLGSHNTAVAELQTEK